MSGTGVYFAGVPTSMAHSDISELFSSVGKVTGVELFTNGQGEPNGMGTVKYIDTESATRAVNKLNRKDVRGTEIYVKFDLKADGGKGGYGKGEKGKGDYGYGSYGKGAWDKGGKKGKKGGDKGGKSSFKGGSGRDGPGKPGCRIFFSNAAFLSSDGYLRGHFEKIGTVTGFKLWRDQYGSSKGMGVVEMETAELANKVIEELTDLQVDGRPLALKLDDRPSNPEARVFFSNVPYGTSEGYLRARFEKIGKVVAWDLWRHADGSSKGMGVVELESREIAEQCVEELKESLIDGRNMLLRLDARPDPIQ